MSFPLPRGRSHQRSSPISCRTPSRTPLPTGGRWMLRRHVCREPPHGHRSNLLSSSSYEIESNVVGERLLGDRSTPRAAWPLCVQLWGAFCNCMNYLFSSVFRLQKPLLLITPPGENAQAPRHQASQDSVCTDNSTSSCSHDCAIEPSGSMRALSKTTANGSRSPTTHPPFVTHHPLSINPPPPTTHSPTVL